MTRFRFLPIILFSVPVTMPPVRVAIIGHSFVSHLNRYTRKERPNFLLDRDFCQVIFHGISGMTMQNLAGPGIFEWVRSAAPTLIIIDMGTNDIDSQHQPIERLVYKFLLFGRKLVSLCGVTRVVFLQVFPCAWGRFAAKKTTFTQDVRRRCKSSNSG